MHRSWKTLGFSALVGLSLLSLVTVSLFVYSIQETGPSLQPNPLSGTQAGREDVIHPALTTEVRSPQPSSFRGSTPPVPLSPETAVKSGRDGDGVGLTGAEAEVVVEPGGGSEDPIHDFLEKFAPWLAGMNTVLLLSVGTLVVVCLITGGTVGLFLILTKMRGALGRIFALANPDFWLIVWGTFFLFAGTVTQMVMPAVLGDLSNLVTSQEDPESKSARLNRTIFLLVIAMTAGSVFTMLRGAFFTLAGERVVARLRRRLFLSLVRQEIGFFDEVQSGELVNRLAADATTIQNAATVNVSMGLRWLAQAVLGLLVLFLVSWKLTLVMVAVVPPVAVFAVLYGKLAGKVSEQYQKALAEGGEVASEVFGGIRTVRSFSMEVRKEAARYNGKVDAAYKLGVKQAWYYGGFSGVVGLVAYLAIALVLWYGGKLVISGEMSPGTLTSFLFYTLYVAIAVGGLGDLFSQLMKAVGASRRIFSFIDREPLVNCEGGERPDEGVLGRGGKQTEGVKGKGGAIAGEIVFENVEFAYPQRSDVQVARGLSFTCKPGEVVALVGPSGAGKSTIVALIERFYDPTAGSVSLDGRNLKDLDPRWLHEKVALVAQEPALFSGTVAENIAYGREAGSWTMEEVQKAAEEANAHTFISGFPDGYDTKVGERGVQLSGGQKQRVAIARALMMNPRVLLLDEATSALDAESEALVQKALERVMKGRTVVIIAHRLSTVRDADQVLVLNQGKVVESGTHPELLKAGGLYRDLVRRQLQWADGSEGAPTAVEGEDDAALLQE
uniref:Uncharacterized protein n=1 Tax=Chromera velia CCMP2878 TaxID=1169474 RepID=A0A0K6S6H4_9ALVE|eukprot:Cvel_17393.t1-p1 / transcript=Cvel_17393.t1 / gene=Cvel_17393 / organism=Chromera_velia_CCMP2878 / gene_product=ABC transporter B family member 25, putative / transcript_product=ABC transporter B family member 25, putative / location=Cvel_scaffold1384:20665-27194(-) / protein_length=782 / sequence_SO=supercontig / SO=protein_coding / is_pseudo=false